MQRRKIVRTVIFLILIQCSVNSLFAQFENTTLVVRYDSAWTYRNLKLIPVRYLQQPGNGSSPVDDNIKIISLSQAMLQKKIKINELPKNVGADVSTLKLKNESNDYILVNSGEVITGGK